MKILLILATLMLGPRLCPAETTNLGLSQTAATGNADVYGSVLYARSADGRLRQVTGNPDGTLALGIVTSITNVAATWLTQTVTTYNLTASAGESVPLEVGLTAGTGGAACRYLFHPTLASAPTAATLLAGGRYLATTTTVQIDGKWAIGTHMSIVGAGAAAVTGTLELRK
jgi:hypothetical protein